MRVKKLISFYENQHYFTILFVHNFLSRWLNESFRFFCVSHVKIQEKSYFIIVLHKISCTRQFESQLSLRSFALSFRVKDCLSALHHLIGCFQHSNMEANLIRLSRISRISQILFRCIPPSIALSLFFVSHRSHRFTQIFSLQATVVTMLHSNRCFSAREFLIGFTEHELHELHEYVA